MDLRPLGTTGLLVSPIGLGTVKLGRNRGVKYPGGEGFALPTDEQAAELFTAAADMGVNLIDTAPAYGSSEERIGAVMHKNEWFGGRDRWVLATKAGEEFENVSGESRFDFSPTGIRESVERSLRRLRTDYLDLVLIHSDGRDEWIIRESGALEVLSELTRMGTIRAFGMSTKTVDGGLMAIRRAEGVGGACDAVMVEYNPVHRTEGYVIDSAAHRGVGVLIKKALGSGHLKELWHKTPAEFKGATEDPVEAALRFVFLRRGVSSVVLGTANPAHLRANVLAAEAAGA